MARSTRDRQQQLIDAVRREHVPDFRSGVFEVVLEQDGGAPVLTGESTHPAAVTDLIERLRAKGIDAADRVTRLPDVTFGTSRTW